MNPAPRTVVARTITSLLLLSALLGAGPARAQSGLVAAWGFDEGSGTTTADASGSGYTGTLANAPVWTAGKFGSALQFNASDDGNDDNDPRVVLGRGIDIPELPFTITVWVNPVDYADWRAILSKRDSPHDSDSSRFDLGLRVENGKVYFFTGSEPVYFDYSPPVNSWTHLAVVARSSGTRLYVNGVLRQTIEAVSLGYNNAANTVIGGTGEGSGGDNDPFKGKIDELRLYSGALTQAQIQAVMNTPLADTVAPSAPAGLNATVVSTNQINLSWTASTDNVGVTGYRVERCQGAGCASFAQIATSTGTSFSDTGLAAATSYSYRVRAADAAGNLSAYSNVASAATQGGQLYYIVPDHLNTPRMIANQQGTTVWKWDQAEPFGATGPNADPDGDGVSFDFPLRFPGQYADRETGLSYNFFRDYDPTVGRYVQSDLIGLRGGLNTYSYASGSPIIWTDPFGLFCFNVHISVSYSALRDVGASFIDAVDLAIRTAAADVSPSYLIAQAPRNANRHGMARPGQSRNEAREGAEEYIDANIRKCTYQGLANALHAAQDSAALGHRFFQEYDGSVDLFHRLTDCIPGQAVERDARGNSDRVIERAKKICGGCVSY